MDCRGSGFRSWPNLTLEPLATPPPSQDQFERLPVPLECEALPEFKYIVDRAQAHMRSDELRKRKELQAQVDKASFQSLELDLAKDVAPLQEYDTKLTVARELWTDQVQSYKRNRRNRGLTRVQKIMDHRLSVVELDPSAAGGFKSIPKHYGMFKNLAAKDMDTSSIDENLTTLRYIYNNVYCLRVHLKTLLCMALPLAFVTQGNLGRARLRQATDAFKRP